MAEGRDDFGERLPAGVPGENSRRGIEEVGGVEKTRETLSDWGSEDNYQTVMLTPSSRNLQRSMSPQCVTKYSTQTQLLTYKCTHVKVPCYWWEGEILILAIFNRIAR